MSSIKLSCLIVGNSNCSATTELAEKAMLKNLEDILITDELQGRTSRASNLQAENQVSRALARQLVNQPQTMLQSLVDIALELCKAGTAGVSLLEVTPSGEEVFRWNVLAGTLKQYVSGTTPRHFSPCGICLDRGTPQLFSHPERYFTYFQAAKTPVVEGLVLPIIAENHALGTIWIMSHSEERHFDPEDVRVMTILADFTGAALLSNRFKTQELIAKNAQLEIEINNRKRAEESLQESEAYFRAIVNLVPDMLWRNDVTGYTSWYNQRWFDYTGQTLEEAQGYGWLNVIHPEDRAQFRANFQNAVDERRPLRQEHRIRGRDGFYRWFLVQASPVFDSDGCIIQWFGTASDIHDTRMVLEHKRESEAALRDSEAKYRSLFNSIDEGFGIAEIIFDHQDEPLDIRWLEVNPQFEHLTGLPRDEVLSGKTIRQVAPNLEAYWFQIYGHVAKCGEPIRFEEHSPLLGRWFDVYAFRIGAPQLRRVAVLFNDISKRKQTEAALRESEEHFRAFIKASSDIVYKMSADWSVMHNLVGKQFIASTVNPKRNWLEKYIPAYEQPFVRAAIEEAIRSKSNFELEHRVFQADGTVGWTFSRAIPLLDEQGEIVEWLGAASDVTEDVTERKRVSAQLRRAAVFDAFRIKLLDALRPLTDPVQIQTQACRLLGEHLGVDRAYYVELNEALGEARVLQDYLRGDSPSLIGVFELADYGWTVPFL